MSDKAKLVDPEALKDMAAAQGRLLDRHPAFAEAVFAVVDGELEKGPKAEEQDPWGHVAEHFRHIFPAVMSDERVQAQLPDVASDFMNLPGTPKMRGGSVPGAIGGGMAIPGWTVVAAGAAAAGAAFWAISSHCLQEVHAEPGTSAEVPHLGPFC